VYHARRIVRNVITEAVLIVTCGDNKEVSEARLASISLLGCAHAGRREREREKEKERKRRSVIKANVIMSHAMSSSSHVYPASKCKSHFRIMRSSVLSCVY